MTCNCYDLSTTAYDCPVPGHDMGEGRGAGPALTMAELVLERVQFHVAQALGRQGHEGLAKNFHVEARADRLTREIVAHFTATALGVEGRDYEWSVSYPATWAQHLKQRFAPRWFLRRWPVRETTRGDKVRIYERLCPHIAVHDRCDHISFLANDAWPGVGEPPA